VSAEHRILAVYISLCAVTLVLLVGFLWTSQKRIWAAGENQLSYSTDLIAEWIDSAFVASDFVLRDMVGHITPDELLFPHPDPIRHSALSELLDARRQSLPHAFLFGVFDANCIVTHGNAVLGFDASDREYCEKLRDDPKRNSIVTHGYASNVGPLNVTHARALRDANDKFLGIVAVALDVRFFDEWLQNMGVGPLDALAIVDTKGMLLARYPAVDIAAGEIIDNSYLGAFIAEDQKFLATFFDSPIDGESRYWGARKVSDLPFVVMVGIDPSTWKAEWYWIGSLSIVGWLTLIFLATLFLRSHLQVLAGKTEILQQSHSDPLTGVPNRRAFSDRAAKSIAHAECNKSWISLLLIDIDHFKNINDEFGHKVGDMALCAFAKCCAAVVGSADVFARWGGDEFVILVEAEPAAAQLLGKRIQEKIRANEILTPDGRKVSLDATIGIASVKADTSVDLEELLRYADEALLKTKLSDRGRITQRVPSISEK